MRGSAKRFLIPFFLGVIGLLMNLVVIGSIFPKYLILDFPLIVVAYYSFFEKSEWALLPTLLLAAMRDIYMGGNQGSIFFMTLAIYYFGRYFYRRLYVESDLFLLISVGVLFIFETVTLTLVGNGAYGFSPGIYFPFTEMFRVSVNAFISIPIFYGLIRRAGPLVYEL